MKSPKAEPTLCELLLQHGTAANNVLLNKMMTSDLLHQGLARAVLISICNKPVLWDIGHKAGNINNFNIILLVIILPLWD